MAFLGTDRAPPRALKGVPAFEGSCSLNFSIFTVNSPLLQGKISSSSEAVHEMPVLERLYCILILPASLVVKVKWSRYRPGVVQRVGRGIALLFHDRGTGRGWVVSFTPRPHLTPWKDPVPVLQEAGWAPRPVWKGGKSRPPPGFDPGPSSP